MPRAEWALKAEQNRLRQIERNHKAIYNIAVKLHAKRMIDRMNREVMDPSKVIYDPEKKEWRKITEEELSDNLKNVSLDVSGGNNV